MTTWIKEGVCGDLNPEIRKCKGRLVRYYRFRGKDFFITSKREGNHFAGSCHPEGDAIDFLGLGEPMPKLKAVCGKDFDVVNEGNHIHCEYDPK